MALEFKRAQRMHLVTHAVIMSNRKEEKKQTRLDAIENVRKEILFLGETPMAEYEFTSEPNYFNSL